MLQRFILISIILLTLLMSYHVRATSALLTIDTTGIKLFASDSNTSLRLAVVNHLSRDINALIEIELLDPANNVRLKIDQEKILHSSTNQINIPLSADKLVGIFDNNLLWYRLHYRIIPKNNERLFEPLEDIISLSEIASNLFDLKVLLPTSINAGDNIFAQVSANHPLTGAPIGNVEITAEILSVSGSNNEKEIITTHTDAAGHAILNLQFPNKPNGYYYINTVINGQLGFFHQTINTTNTISIVNQASILISTDKSLYQPGQLLHSRLLLIIPNRYVLADEELLFVIEDQEHKKILQKVIKTSKFGVASLDWPIPDDIRLGNYYIRVSQQKDGFHINNSSQSLFKISRYELPNFTVITKPDRSYYLPTENAKVEVRADYLFGQPVRRGRVKITYRSNPQQQLNLTEKELFNGETDEDGRVVVDLDLISARQNFSYFREEYKDIEYVAYYTDLTNDRTEERRFNLRITKEPIHIYLSQINGSNANNRLDDLYISTFYADGSPAQCQLTISEMLPDKVGDPNFPSSFYGVKPQNLTQIITNRYGMAKISGINFSSDALNNKFLSLHIKARDNDGHESSLIRNLPTNNQPIDSIKASKTFYRAGEPLTVSINTARPESELCLFLSNEHGLLRSRTVKLENGQGEVTFPYNSDLTGLISIKAIQTVNFQGLNQTFQSVNSTLKYTVIYPDQEDLQLEIKLDRADYQPGSEVNARIRARGGNGQAIESMLGAVVVDRAVAEREFNSDLNVNEMTGFDTAYKSNFSDFQAVAGVTPTDILRLNPSKPIPADLQLLAEVIFNSNNSSINNKTWQGWQYCEASYNHDVTNIFQQALNRPFQQLNAKLFEEYANINSPTNIDSLQQVLIHAQLNLDLNSLRDLWNRPYQFEFSYYLDEDSLKISSSGPDQRVGTADDILVATYQWARLGKVREATFSAFIYHHYRTGGYINNEATLRAELLTAGIDLNSLTDHWGRKFKIDFRLNNSHYQIRYLSAGPDGEFSNLQFSDDILYYETEFDFTSLIREKLINVIEEFVAINNRYPSTEAEFQELLKRAHIDTKLLLDPWGNLCYLDQTRIKTTPSKFNDYFTRGNFLKPNLDINNSSENIASSPKQIDGLGLFSNGPDGKPYTDDDVRVMIYVRGYFTLTGTVADTTDAVIQGVTVEITNLITGERRSITTNEHGVYNAVNLELGNYNIEFTAEGFKTVIISDINLYLPQRKVIDAKMEPTSSDLVYVESGDQSVNINGTDQQLSTLADRSSSVNNRNYLDFSITTNTSNKTVKSELQAIKPQSLRAPSTRMITPRVREDFRDTVLWQPEIEVDRAGRTDLRFKLGDSATTWRLMIVGSTMDGKLATAEKEITAFQPFIVEHEPPQILTEGDELALPVVLRNYLTEAINVKVAMKPEPWFALLDEGSQQCRVASADTNTSIFKIRATAAIKDGKQRVTASGIGGGDAVEKKVTVHPNGEEQTISNSIIFNDNGEFSLNVPTGMLKDSLRAELKFYPGMLTHAFEGIEGLLMRPHGCGEQTISSTYPNLMVLRYLNQNHREHSLFAQEAEHNLIDGYKRLLEYQDASGGFCYWQKGSPDLSLTAYALRFLADAKDLIQIDDSVPLRATNWLLAQQQQDGSWINNHTGEVVMNTALIARLISTADAQNPATARALNFLEPLILTDKVDESYSLACYIIASINIGRTTADSPALTKALTRLRALAITNQNLNYWPLNGNTPFHGWGEVGTIETTAMAIQALIKINKITNEVDNSNSRLINNGLFFLLSKKDEYGVWYSTQTTINVLDALLKFNGNAGNLKNTTFAIIINHRRAGEITLNGVNDSNAPINFSISQYLTPGENKIELQRIKSANSDYGDSLLVAQSTLKFFIPWQESNINNPIQTTANGLNFGVSFDKTTAAIGEEIICTVTAERINRLSNGMLLAEIGLPPGIVVDRNSLDNAKLANKGNISSYELLPDRVVVYLWPQHSAQFEFKIKARYGIKALSAPSQLYDYYNPTAKVVLPPSRFKIPAKLSQ